MSQWQYYSPCLQEPAVSTSKKTKTTDETTKTTDEAEDKNDDVSIQKGDIGMVPTSMHC